MKLYLNELSFNVNMMDKDNAIKKLNSLINCFVTSKSIAFEKKGHISDNIFDMVLYENITLKQFIIQTLDSNSQLEKDLKTKLFVTIFNKPRVNCISLHQEEQSSIVDSNGEDLKNSCLDNAAGSEFGALVCSLPENDNLSENCFIHITSSIYGEKKILNICSIDELEKITWKYEHHKKHTTEPRNINGKIASPMTLNLKEAQDALSNGILINGIVYSVKNGKYYKFHNHIDNLFHGYDYKLQSNIKDDNIALNFFKKNIDIKTGQVFHDYL